MLPQLDTGSIKHWGRDLTHIRELLTRIPTVKVTSRLLNDLKIKHGLSSWLEQGLSLHEDRKDCYFCNQQIPKGRKSDLSHLFSESFEDFISELQSEKLLMEEMEVNINFDNYSQDKFYDNLLNDRCREKERLEDSLYQYNDCIHDVVDLLNKKMRNPYENLNDEIESNVFDFHDEEQELIESWKAFNSVILHNNEYTQSFSEKIKQNKEKIKSYYSQRFIKDVSEKQLKIKDIKLLGEKVERIELLKNENDNKIRNLKSMVKELHGTADYINNKLDLFLGFSNLKLQVNEDGQENNFQITRCGKLAKNLSEGEKTLISFCYFLVHIEETIQNLSNDQEKIIVFIDDPVSSLDDIHLFTIFSYLEQLQEKTKIDQIFITTHNFNLYKFLSFNANNHKNKKNKNFYILESNIENDQIYSNLRYITNKEAANLTEASFLFNNLYTFSMSKDNTNYSAFDIGNQLRKFMEGYIETRTPGEKDSSFIINDETSKNAIKKFNDYWSHADSRSLDCSLGPRKKVAFDAVKIFMKKLEENDPRYFEAMKSKLGYKERT